jgi:hypothetical protein
MDTRYEIRQEDKMYYKHVGDTYTNIQFMIHENDFEYYVNDLVSRFGEEWEHSLDYRDEVGNREYVPVDKTEDHTPIISYCPECGVMLEQNQDNRPFCPECLTLYL